MDWQEELRKRRIEAARAKGWDEQTIQRFALVDRAQSQLKQQQARPQPEPRQGGLGGTLLSLVPFGTIAQKALTGRAGEISPMEVIGEAALTAVPFGIGRIAKGARAAKTAAATAKETKRVAKTTGIPTQKVKESIAVRDLKPVAPTSSGQTLPQQAQQLFKPTRDDNILQEAGSKVRGFGRNIVPGAKPEGATERLTPSASRQINKNLDEIGAKGGVVRQLETVEANQSTARNLIDQSLATNNKTVAPKRLLALQERIKKGLVGGQGEGIAGFGKKTDMELANRLSRQMATTGDLAGLEKFRRSLDDLVNWNRNNASPDPMVEKIARVFRREIDKEVSTAIPDLKKAKTLYAKMEEAKDALVVGTPMSLQESARQGNMLAKVFSSAAVQSGLSGTGRALQGAGNLAATPAASFLASQGLTRGIANSLGRGQEPALPESPAALFADSQNPEEALLSQIAAQGVTDPQSMLDVLTPMPEQPAQEATGGLAMSSTDLFNNALQTAQAGDLKGAKEIMNFAEMAASLEKQGMSGQPKMSAAQQKDFAKITEAGRIADQIEQALGQAGGAQGMLGFLPLAAAKATSGTIAPSVRSYEALRQASIAPLARAISGEVGVLTDADVRRAEQLLPKINDAPEVARQKLANLRQAIAGRQQDITTMSGSSSMLPEDILQLFQQQERGY